MHEKRMHRLSCFLSLTYDDEFLPEGGTLVKRDLQLFMKRLRKRFGDGIRFYGCGEYGGRSLRPHYHLLLFNFDFPDKKVYKRDERGGYLYTSGACEELWAFGYNVIGSVDFNSCAYVARYICDKLDGDRVEEYGGRAPEFSVMSRRPGIGTGWFEKYGRETYLHDSVIMNGREVLPPRFYDMKLDDEVLKGIKRERKLKALKNFADNTVDRRIVKEQVVLRNLARMKRDVL